MRIKNIGRANIIAIVRGNQKVIAPEEVIELSKKEWEKLKEYPQLADIKKIFGDAINEKEPKTNKHNEKIKQSKGDDDHPKGDEPADDIPADPNNGSGS